MTFLMFLWYLCLLGAWISFPLIPAIIIYRRFPDTPLAANGVLSGLRINTGGAFAAYLVIFLTIFPLINKIGKNIENSSQRYWRIIGTVKLVDPHTQRPVKYNTDLFEDMDFAIKPKILTNDDHEIDWKVLEQGGRLHKVTIDVPGWGKETVNLNRRLSRLKTQQSFVQRLLSFLDQTDGELNIGEIEVARILPGRLQESRSPMERPK